MSKHVNQNYVPRRYLPWLIMLHQKYYAKLGVIDYATKSVQFIKGRYPAYMGYCDKERFGCTIVIDPVDKENIEEIDFNFIQIYVDIDEQLRERLDKKYTENHVILRLSTAMIVPEAGEMFHLLKEGESFGMMDLMFTTEHLILHIDGAQRFSRQGYAVYRTTGYCNNTAFRDNKKEDGD